MHENRQPLGRSWRVWDLDAETRYWPVVDELPDSTLPICEVGSGAAGLASWTTRAVVGVDPGADERHAGFVALGNLRRVVGSGSAIPLDDGSVCAAIAIDTFEHVPPAGRRAVVAEMVRVTAPGGRVIICGPTGADAAEGDRWLVDALARRGPLPDWSLWLGEHFENGLPTHEEMLDLLEIDRVASLRSRGVISLRHWRLMHRLAMGPCRVPGRAQPALLSPLRQAAHRARRGPYYRSVYVADVK